MFSEIYGSKQPVPWQSYSLMLCSAAVTVASLVFPNLRHVFGSFDEGTGIMQRLTVAFQHGFEMRSAVVHLLVDLVLYAMMGIFLEKVMGAWMFFLLNFSAILFYIIVHLVFDMTGHGGSGLIWAYAPLVFYTLNEGRLLKTRSQFDEFYRTLRTVLVVMYTLIPLLMSIIPIYFDSESPLLQSVINGNLFHVTATLWGIGFLMIYRENVRTRLKQFAKKKKFEWHQGDQYETIYPWIYPLFILIGFIFLR